jgi:CHAT domain-containing protein/Tfp pilus assembly protein PilF
MISGNILEARITQIEKKLSTQEFKSAYRTGEVSRREGEFELALASFDAALSLAQRNKSEIDVINCRRERAVLFWNLGNLNESLAEYTEILELADRKDLPTVSDACRELISITNHYIKGKDHRSAGNFQDSINEFNLAIEKAKNTRSKEHELKCLRQLSLTYWELEDLQQFFSLNSKAFAIAEALSHRLEQSRCLNNIGLSYWRFDDYSAALKYLHRANDMAQLSGNLESEAECLSNIGIVYFDLGDYDRAMENLNKALAIDKKLGDQESISKDLVNIGESHRRKGLLTGDPEDLSLALSTFNEALKLAQKTRDSRTEVTILNNLGATYSHLGNNLRALEYFLAGLNNPNKLQNVEAMGMLLNNIGIVYSQLGNYEESTKYYQKAIDMALGISGGKILWEAYLEMADSYKRQGKWDAALENYSKSISVIENIRSSIDTEELKATYLGTDKRIDAYYNIIDLYIRLAQKKQDKRYEAKAFDFLEKAKARSFLDSIEVSKLNLTAGIDRRLLNRETELMNDISRLHTKLLAPQLSSEQRDAFTAELENNENDLDSLKREIREASPGYANLNYPSTVTLEEAQRELIDEGTVCFAYALGKEGSYAFAVSRNDLKIYALPPKKIIQELVQKHLQSITDPAKQAFPDAHELFKLLIKPGLHKNINKIVIIPDDALYLFPFETLMTEADGREWLIKEYNIAYIPSLSSSRELLERSRSGRSLKRQKDILAIGDPDYGANELDGGAAAAASSLPAASADKDFQFQRLAYSGQEVQEIAALFKPQRSDVLLREQATEEKFKSKDLSNYRILHFAAHAVIDNKKPSRSAIVLNLDQDPMEDGFIQMREVFNLKLQADLVVLSACETGLGRLLRGEGIEGLNRAFFYAGASSVLLSLWAINDQASYQLLERFYVHLRSSNSIMSALREAKLEMINSGVLDHPYYWAGFIVTGEADKVIFPRDLKRWLIATLSIALGVALLLFFVNRDRAASFIARG